MERDWLRNLLASDLRKGIFPPFFSSYFYINKLASDPILAHFHQPGNSLPPTQPCFFGGRRGPGGRTRSVDDFLCYPAKWNSCLFLKDAHTGLLCHPACSTMGRVSLESFLPIPHTQKIRTATIQRFWHLQPSKSLFTSLTFSINWHFYINELK